MNQEQLEAKGLGDLREIAKLQGVKSVTKYRKPELIRIIMNGGVPPKAEDVQETPAEEPAAVPQKTNAESEQRSDPVRATAPQSVLAETRQHAELDHDDLPKQPAFTPRPQGGYQARRPSYYDTNTRPQSGYQSGYQQGYRQQIGRAHV